MLLSSQSLVSTKLLSCHSGIRRSMKVNASAPNAFGDEELQSFNLSILGDLHLPHAPGDLNHFYEARDQLLSASPSIEEARVVQLGDLGSYEKGWP